jgi:multidrug resistance efflux pump
MPANPIRDEPGPGPQGPRRFGLVLPGSPGDDLPGGALVRRAVSWVMLLFALLLGAGLAVAALLEIDVTVTGRGVLEPADVWPVRSREPGTILAVKVATGDTVTGGRPLLELDPFEHRQTLAELEARRRQRLLEHDKAVATQPIEAARQRERVAAAAAAVVQARAGLRAELADRGLNPNVDSALNRYAPESGVALDVAIAAVRAAQAEHRSQLAQLQVLELADLDRQREQAELDLLTRQIAAAHERLNRLVIAAPATGVVLTQDVHRLVGARVQAGEVLLELGDPSAWEATVLVSADDVHRIRPGDSVRVELEAFRREDRHRIDGVVRFIGPQPALQDGDRPGGGYRVAMALDPAQLALLGQERLRRGYAVEGTIVTRSGNAFGLLWGYVRDRLDR